MMNMIKVGDLIEDLEYPDFGLVVEIKSLESNPHNISYKVLYVSDEGTQICEWFPRKYVEEDCGVVS